MLEIAFRDGIRLVTSPALFEKSGIIVAFTGRQGGVSSGPCGGLNLSYNVGDSPLDVGENRKRLSCALGVPQGRWTLPIQVHGTTVREAGPLQVGRGCRDHASGIPRTDALVTGTTGVAVAVLTADCAPVVMAVPGASCAAVAHAGWRGLLGGVVAKTLGRLLSISGGAAEDVVAFVGPRIGACCMTVGEEVAGTFEARFHGRAVTRSDGGSPSLDLGEACAWSLETSGVRRGDIHVWGECTFCGHGYFSHRGAVGGRTGRQAGIAVVV